MSTPITLLLVLLLWPLRAVADERWYIFSIGGTPVGWVTEVTDGLRTRTTVEARLTRLGKSVDMRLEVTTTEDAAGALQILGYETLLSKQPMRLEVRVEGRRVRILTPQERVVDRGPEPLLGPVAVARLTSRRLRTAGDRIEYAVFSPELQRVAKVRRHLVAIAERAECGSAPVNRVEETIEGLPGPRTLWLDADAVMVGDSIAGPFGPKFRVAMNRALTHRFRRPPRGEPLDRASHVFDSRPTPEAEATASEQRASLLAALQALPLAMRQILALSLEGLSGAEIAHILGITENNAAVCLNRARRALQEALHRT